MSVNIQIESNDSVKITLSDSETGVTSTKTTDIPSLVESLSSLQVNSKDTGYLHPSLLREVVNNKTIRLFYYPRATYTVVVQGSTLDINDNKYGITSKNNSLIIPKFTIKDVVGIFKNNTSTGFNNTHHYIGVIKPNLVGTINDQTEFYKPFPNHFTSSICWPDSFNKGSLDSLDYRTQSSSINMYFSSPFNTDLFSENFDESFRNSIKDDVAFIAFLEELGLSYSSLSSIYIYFLTYFYMSTIKDINPADYFQRDSEQLSYFF